MNKEDIYNFIKNRKIWYEITEHNEVYTMEDLSKINLPYPDCDAKNLFVRDDKKINYYLITVKNNKKVNLKEFRKKYQTRPLTFSSEEELSNILSIRPGSVSPLGILNDKDCKVKFYLDEEFLYNDGIIGVHPNDNTATIWLKTLDLINIIDEHGNNVNLVNFNI